MAAEVCRTAMAVGAHPDDIEFLMAGTLLRLKEAGLAIHMWNLANGHCGTATLSREEIIAVRAREARESADIAGATLHAPLVDDLAIVYDLDLLSKIAAVVREVQPDILLLPSPEDYMEDHQNTSRLLVTAAFARAMRPYRTTPEVEPYDRDVTIYHAMPIGFGDQLRRPITAEQYVDITAEMATKRAMLACHRSQKEWLDVSQGKGAYITYMEDMCREMGRRSGSFDYAEGWRRHLHIGLSADEIDPLGDLLGDACRMDS